MVTIYLFFFLDDCALNIFSPAGQVKSDIYISDVRLEESLTGCKKRKEKKTSEFKAD